MNRHPSTFVKDCPLCGWVSSKYGKLCKLCAAAYDKHAATEPDNHGMLRWISERARMHTRARERLRYRLHRAGWNTAPRAK